MRTKDITLVQEAIDQYAEQIEGLDLPEWLANPSNVALTNEYRDVALFERQWRHPDVVCGHYFFHSRGKQAREEAKKMLKEIFTGPYFVKNVTGFTPVDNKGALWMNRQLGFTDLGTVDAPTGECKYVYLTKSDWILNNE